MKKLLILPLLFFGFSACANRDARSIYLDTCEKDSSLSYCSDFTLSSPNVSNVSRKDQTAMTFTFSRPATALFFIDAGAGTFDVAEDRIIAVSLRQENGQGLSSQAIYPIAREQISHQISLGSDQNPLPNNFNLLTIRILPSDTSSLDPMKRSFIYIEMEDWKGNKNTYSFEISITS